jgi:hypothetical protein
LLFVLVTPLPRRRSPSNGCSLSARRVELTGSESRPAGGLFDEHRVGRRVWLERLLIEEDMTRALLGRVAISLPRYSTAANLVRRGNMISTLPQSIALREAERERDPQYGFHEYHARTMDNPLLPKRLQNETHEAWQQRQAKFQTDLIKDNDPLVYAQEYLAEFVDWSGAAFFNREKLLDHGQPVPSPATCDGIFAVIDTASKTGTDNDATAVTFFAHNRLRNSRLLVLDWDIIQIEGAILEKWLPQVFQRLEELARQHRARNGSLGAFIEDKNSGTILLQQAQRRGMLAHAIDSKLTAMGKDERAISVSGYVHRGEVKYTEPAFNKTTIYKRKSRNHLLDQVESFRIGDKKSDREDDLLDTFCYGIALALGNREGF